MTDVVLIYPTPEGSREIEIIGERTTFGRGSEAEHRFPDDGLSRLHSTIYREGERVWIVDENSSNGTFVNGAKVPPAGTPLRDGDSIKIGHQTVIRVRAQEKRSEPTTVAASVVATSNGGSGKTSVTGPISILPIVLIAFALLLVSVSVVFIAFQVFKKDGPEIVQNSLSDNDPPPVKDKDPKATPGGSPPKDPKPGATPTGTSNVTTAPGGTTGPTSKPPYSIPAGKTYLQLTETEKRDYLRDRAMRVAQVIGNNSSEDIPALAIDRIKAFTDAFAKRGGVKPLGGCKFGDNLQSTYERASKNAPFIVRAFNEKGIDPRIGLYLAMIESEHCICLQSPTGPLGMFQFTKSTGEMHGLKTKSGASPTNPDERCEPEPSARAAASYMKALTGRYGTGPSSVPLAIGSYNSGEGGLSSNLVKALETNTGLTRDFWTLIANGDKLSKQFQSENFKYVPKFFAAAIVGEYPQDFGLKLQALSTYSN